MSGSTTKIAKRMQSAGPGVVDARLRWLMIGVMVLAVLATLLNGALSEPSVRENFTNSRSHSPGGHSALVQLLMKDGYKVESTTARLDRLDDEFFKRGGQTLALLEPSQTHVREHWPELSALFGDERKANIILALPKRRYAHAYTEDGQVVLHESIVSVAECRELLKLAGLDDELEFNRVNSTAALRSVASMHEVQRTGSDGILQFFRLRNLSALREKWFDPQSGTKPLVQVLIEDADANPVALRFNERNLVVLADPDILSNRFIGEGDAAALAKAVMAAGGTRKLAIDETMHGLSAPVSLEYLAVRPPALWALLSLLLLLGVFYWREATVLRPAQAESETRRSRALVIEGVARLMARARDFGHAAQALLKRAPFALQSSRTRVHAAGMAGSSVTGLPRELEQRLNAIRYAGGTEEGLVQVAQAVARLKIEQSLEAHVPKRIS